MLLTFLHQKTYTHPSDVSKRSYFPQCLLKKVKRTQANPFYPTSNKKHPKSFPWEKSQVWRGSLMCQQMHRVWPCSAYATDDTAEIWNQLFPTTTFSTWLEACDMLGTEQLHQSLPSLAGKSPSLSLKIQAFHWRKWNTKHSWNVWLSLGSDWSWFPPGFVATLCQSAVPRLAQGEVLQRWQSSAVFRVQKPIKGLGKISIYLNHFLHLWLLDYMLLIWPTASSVGRE